MLIALVVPMLLCACQKQEPAPGSDGKKAAEPAAKEGEKAVPAPGDKAGLVEGKAQEGAPADKTAADGDKPAAEGEKPAAEGDKPAAEGDKPAAEGEKPAAEGDKPAAEGDKPAAEGDKPAAEGEKPAAEGDKPAAEGDKPAAEGDKAAEQPAGDNPSAEATKEGDVEKKFEKKGQNPEVIFETTKGVIRVELYPDKTPITVKNFLQYAEDGFYEGTVFHRVVAGFVIQGGGYSTDLAEQPTRAPIENEAAKGISNARGTIAMARTNQRNSATSQFYISLRNNTMLDYRGESAQGWGYCAFGKVTEGMEVVDAIGSVRTGPAGMFPAEVPQESIVVNKVTVLK
jgi:cyclophilin family peptidyl-prolyl cis-trans isomerase